MGGRTVLIPLGYETFIFKRQQDGKAIWRSNETYIKQLVGRGFSLNWFEAVCKVNAAEWQLALFGYLKLSQFAGPVAFSILFDRRAICQWGKKHERTESIKKKKQKNTQIFFLFRSLWSSVCFLRERIQCEFVLGPELWCERHFSQFVGRAVQWSASPVGFIIVVIFVPARRGSSLTSVFLQKHLVILALRAENCCHKNIIYPRPQVPFMGCQVWRQPGLDWNFLTWLHFSSCALETIPRCLWTVKSRRLRSKTSICLWNVKRSFILFWPWSSRFAHLCSPAFLTHRVQNNQSDLSPECTFPSRFSELCQLEGAGGTRVAEESTFKDISVCVAESNAQKEMSFLARWCHFSFGLLLFFSLVLAFHSCSHGAPMSRFPDNIAREV